MFLTQPPDTEATARYYQADVDARGYVMNLSRAWAWRADVGEAFAALRSRLTDDSSLSARELAVLVCATAAVLGDSYCALAWGRRLAEASDDAEVAASVLRCARGDLLPARERALAGWARKVVADPCSTSGEEIAELRGAGLSDREIFEATAFVAFRAAFSSVNAALGAQPDWQLAAAAPLPVRAAVRYGRRVAERPY